MLTVPTAVLLHTTAAGCHHDWLVGDPAAGAGSGSGAGLWTARVEPPPHAWARLGRFPLTPLPPHRALYLRYEGPISGGRGHVQRIDAGYALVLSWRTGPGDGQLDRAVLAVRMTQFAGWIELRRLEPQRCEARVLRIDPVSSA